MQEYVNAYRFHEKFRFASPDDISQPHVRAHLITSPCPISSNPQQEMQFLFNSYVGALYIEGGVSKVEGWVHRVLLPDMTPPASPISSPSPSSSPPPSSYGSVPHTPFNPPQPSTIPPPVPENAGFLPSLAFVNQIAAQKSLSITYTSSSSGPPHQPTWVVHCFSTCSSVSCISIGSITRSVCSKRKPVWRGCRQKPEDRKGRSCAKSILCHGLGSATAVISSPSPTKQNCSAGHLLVFYFVNRSTPCHAKNIYKRKAAHCVQKHNYLAEVPEYNIHPDESQEDFDLRIQLRHSCCRRST